ncbi:MAG: hypothetical protein GC179_28680 [Anaerolineaceae bacterium]|nr:hypothetical protein [Anaerolineaceae bacterium]
MWVSFTLLVDGGKMRKILILITVLVLSVTAAKAQDKSESSPIIAMRDGKVYAVSPEDGSSRLLADPSAENQEMVWFRYGSLSPDGKTLVYVSQSSYDTDPKDFISNLKLVTIADGTTKTVVPSGGVFDVPAGKNERFDLTMATWSYDGQRIYYFRRTISSVATTINKPTQFAYYDVLKDKHELVARLDPKNLLDNLQAVPEGIVMRWYSAGFSSTTTMNLYDPNNRMLKQIEMDFPYLYTLRDKDALYYTQLKDFGNIDYAVNAKTGEKQPFKSGYYPAEQSLMNGDQSMHVFTTQDDFNIYYVYGADYHTPITTIKNTSGLTYAISPDGQQLAYMIYDQGPTAPIQIMDMNGKVRKLDFEAGQILWGTTEYVSFYAPS